MAQDSLIELRASVLSSAREGVGIACTDLLPCRSRFRGPLRPGWQTRRPQTLFPAGSHEGRRSPDERQNETASAGAAQAAGGAGGLPALPRRFPAPRASGDTPAIAVLRGVAAAALRGSAADVQGDDPPGRHTCGPLPTLRRTSAVPDSDKNLAAGQAEYERLRKLSHDELVKLLRLDEEG